MELATRSRFASAMKVGPAPLAMFPFVPSAGLVFASGPISANATKDMKVPDASSQYAIPRAIPTTGIADIPILASVILAGGD